MVSVTYHFVKSGHMFPSFLVFTGFQWFLQVAPVEKPVETEMTKYYDASSLGDGAEVLRLHNVVPFKLVPTTSL